MNRRLGPDLDARLAFGQLPELLQVFIGEGDTTIGPIARLVIRIRLGGPIGLSMDEDISARGLMQRRGSLQVRSARVGNVQRLEVMAVFPAKIDDVAAFGRAKVPLVLFGACRTQAERNAITAQRKTVMQQIEFAFVLDDQNGVGARSSRGRSSEALADES